MAFTLNRRLSTLVNSSGQLNTGKIPNDYISSDHVADNVITTAMLHSGFTLPTSSLSSIDTDNVTEGSSNLYFTNARVDSRLSGGTGVTYSSGAISIGQAVATTDNVTFADLTVTGDLTITGDINSYNVTDLDVADKTITIGKGQTESNSGGSGLIVDGASASILWDETNDEFDFNKGINVDSNTLVVDGTNNRVGILNASPDVSLDLGSATDGIHMPVGTTGQRPSSPAAGYFRYNSTDGQFEGYTTEWGAIAGSGGASAMETNNFTGNGSTTAFTLSSTVASEDNLIVFIEGIYQNKGDYVASGTTLTFTTAPVSGRRIVVQHILSSVAGNSTLYTSLTGDGSTTAFTLSGAPGHENNTQVFMDGVYQQKDSYIVNGTTLTFDAAPANNAEIEVMSFAQTTINQPGTNTVSVAELNLSDGTAGQFITTDGNGTISFASVPAGYTDSDVETYLNTSEIYTDATNDRLGIGTSSPDADLSLLSPVYTSGGTGNGVRFQNQNNNADAIIQSYYSGTSPSALLSGANAYLSTGATFTSFDNAKASSYALLNTNGNIEFGNATSGNPTTKMLLDSSGNVGIGNTVASTLDAVSSSGNLVVGSGSGSEGISVYSGNTNLGSLCFADGTSGTSTYTGYITYNHSNNHMEFGTGGGTERMRINSSGKVGIGTTSPSALLDVAYGDYQNSGALRIGADIGTNTSRTNSTRKIGTLTVPHYTTAEDDIVVFLQDSDTGRADLTIGGGSASFNSPSLINFFTSTDGTAYGTERMRINNSGKLFMGTTGALVSGSENYTFLSTGHGATIKAANIPLFLWTQEATTYGNVPLASFYHGTGTSVGAITTSGSATQYTTSSDYRLKENVNYTYDATTRLKQLKPARFNWISDEDNTEVDGFLAHEVQSVVPEAVVGNKDDVYSAEEAEYMVAINAGDIKPQSIDESKLVPLLVKTIQELEARITTLENA